jgi:hypothetical protein
MARKSEPWWSLLTAQRIYQTGRPLGNRIHTAPPGWARKQRRQRRTEGEAKHQDGTVSAHCSICHQTNTFRRDQELRYTVHDSPDYYQLKVSVFNDDKKTELIGETWVDLKDVVVPGGGQNDLWHNLGCKGKYAGEIRIEITYYDSRPKQEKAEPVKQAATSGADEGGRDSLKGPRQPKAAVKRRPLPSDPVTGAAPASPVVIPDHVQDPPRGYPSSPTAAPGHGQTPPRGYQYPQPAAPDHFQTPPRGYQQPNGTQDHGPTPPRGIQQPSVGPDHNQTPPRGYQGPPSAIPDHVQTPQRGYQTSNYIPNQSPLQNVEYSIPSQQFAQPQSYEISPRTNSYGPPPGMVGAAPPARAMTNDRYETYEQPPRDDYFQANSRDQYGGDDYDHRDKYNSRQSPYDAPQPDEYGSPPSPGGPPPPPPAHRSRQSVNGNAHVSPVPATNSYGSYRMPSDAQSADPYYTPSHDVHRNSIPSNPQGNTYQAYSPEKEQDPFRRSSNTNHEQLPSRHQSYDSRYNGDHGSMQASVEDVPESPGGIELYGHRGSGPMASPYDQVPSPAPLNIGGRGSTGSGRNSMSNTPTHQYSNSANGYSTTNSQASFRDRSHTDTSVSSRTSYNPIPQHQDQRSRGHSQGQIQAMTSYVPPPLPATLVPGMDPVIAQEIQDRIYDEKRASYNQGGDSQRGRYQNPTQYQPNQPKLLSYHESSAMVPFVPASARYDDRQSYYSGDDQSSRYAPSVDDRQSRYSNAIVPVSKPRAVSPDTRATTRKSVSPAPSRATTRKSVSPAPPPTRGGDDQRRLSGIPFGPDSYNAFNPVISNSASSPSLSAAYDTKQVDADAKIITHDGREIDPSDHIPESNYAPLLEKKGPTYASQQPDRNWRPPPTSPQPVSASGRRPLRQAAPRPQSMAASSPIYMNGGRGPEPMTPTGRNRLQKKSNRMSAMPAPNSSPLAPLTSYQDNSYAPRTLPRANTMDYNANENYAPSYGTSPGYGGISGPPPLPAKVPMTMSGSLPPQPDGGDPWALLEEMKNIDLGSGRARRRGYN